MSSLIMTKLTADMGILDPSQDPDNDISYNQYGFSSALSGDGSVLVVGARWWDSTPYGRGNQGAVYIYDRNGDGTWTLRGNVLTPNEGVAEEWWNSDEDDEFGFSVALSDDGSVLAVGARGRLKQSIDGHQFSRPSGAVYIYDLDKDSDTRTQRGDVLIEVDFNPNNWNVYFGSSVALSDDGSVLAVGSDFWKDGNSQGAVYIYDKSGDGWNLRGNVLTPTYPAINDWFGCAVALSGDGSILTVGAYGWDGDLRGPDGNGQGAVYIYDKSGDGWNQRGSVLTLGVVYDKWNSFGSAIALSGDGSVLAVGAVIKDPVYIYDLDKDSDIRTLRTPIKTASDSGAGAAYGRSIALSNDGSVLAIGSDENTGNGAVYIYDELPTYTLSTNLTTVNEGYPLTINVSTTNVDDDTELWWTIESNSGDFDVSSGSFFINNNSGSFTVTPTADATTEDGIETFTVAIRTGSANGTVVTETNSITINDASKTPPPTYTVTTSNTNINEGESLTINVSTTNVDDDTELWWTIESNAGDFDVSSGSFLINNNSGSFAVTPTADATTEELLELFTVAIRIDTINGTVVAETDSIRINDKSKTPPIPSLYQSISVSNSSINEGGNVSFTLNGSNMTSGDKIGQWEIFEVSNSLSFDTPTSGTFNIVNNNSQLITRVLVSDNKTYQGQRNFKLRVFLGNTTLISPTVLVNDDEIVINPDFSKDLVWDEDGNYYRGVFKIDENGISQTFTFDLEKNIGNVSVELQGIDNQFPNLKNSIEVTDCEIFRLSSTKNSVIEGNSFTINFYTNVGAGRYPYKITGVSSDDIDVPLSGEFLVYEEEASVTINTIDHGFDEGIETFRLTLDNEKAFVEVSIIDRYYRMYSQPEIEINENQVLRVELNTNGNDGLYDYNIRGISSPGFSSADFSNFSLDGSFFVQNGMGEIFIPIKRDYLTEGDEYFRVSLNNGHASVDIKINDTSLTRVYYLQASKSTISEGEPVLITLSVEGDVPIGTDIPYTISVDGNEGIDFIGNTVSIPESLHREKIEFGSGDFSSFSDKFGSKNTNISSDISGNSKVLAIGVSGNDNIYNDYHLKSSDGTIFSFSDQVSVSDFDNNDNSWKVRDYNITSPFNLRVVRPEYSDSDSEYHNRGKYSLFWGKSVSLSADGNTLAISSTGYPKIKSDWDGSDNIQSAIENLGEAGTFGDFSLRIINVEDMGFGAIFFYDWDESGQEWIRRKEWISGTLGSLSNLNYWQSESRGGHWFEFGNSISLSGDGKYLAVGCPGFSVTDFSDPYSGRNLYQTQIGMVQIFKRNPSLKNGWELITENNPYNSSYDFKYGGYRYGSSVSFSTNGQYLAVGVEGSQNQSENEYLDPKERKGMVQVYKKDNSIPNHFSHNISGPTDTIKNPIDQALNFNGYVVNYNVSNYFGSDVSFNENGTRIMIGSKLRNRQIYESPKGQAGDVVVENWGGIYVYERRYYEETFEKKHLYMYNEFDGDNVNLSSRLLGDNVSYSGDGSKIFTTVRNDNSKLDIVYDNVVESVPSQGIFTVNDQYQDFVELIPRTDFTSSEGEESFTLSLNNNKAQSTVVVRDSSILPEYYFLESDKNIINEGGTVEIELVTRNILSAEGKQIPFTVSGVQFDDFDNPPLDVNMKGNFTLNSEGKSIVTFTARQDLTVLEPHETLRLSLDNGEDFIDVIIKDSSSQPTYDLTASSDSANEGGIVQVILTTTDVEGPVPYKISGVSLDDFDSITNSSGQDITSSFSLIPNSSPNEYSGGIFNMDERGQLETDFITFNIKEDLSIDEPDEILTVSLDNGEDSVSINIYDTSNIPTYTISYQIIDDPSSIESPSEVDEGKTIIINLKTTDIDPGDLVPFTVSGVQLTDFVNPPLDSNLKGNFYVGSNETSTIQFRISEDLIPENEYFILTIDDDGTQIQVFVVDAKFNLSTSTDSANEGDTFSINLETSNLSRSTQVPFTVSGVSQDDFVNPPFDSSGKGIFILDSNGESTLDFEIREDLSTGEPNETMRLSIDNNNEFIDVVIHDTSFKPLYKLETTKIAVNEGQEFTITLDTLDVPEGSEVEFIITGVTPDDFDAID